MSSYAELYLHGVQIFSWGNEIDPTFLFLFAREEVRRWIEEASVDNDFEPRERVQLVATASVLRDRLDVLGIGREALNEAFDDYVRDKLRSQRATWDMRESIFRDQLPSIEPRMKAGIELLETLTLDRWATLLAIALQSPNKRKRGVPPDPTSLEELLEMWEYADPRLLLGVVLLTCEPDSEVILDVSELIVGGWMDGEFDPQQAAIEEFSYSLINSSPPVVITEGSTDARFLKDAIRIRQPHLQSYIKFFDFVDGAEGSAAAGVRTLKSFAAAGISNRIVLLLDNDTAARDAMRALKGAKLPDHYSVSHYPDIEIARSYPTLGPTGLSKMNVNGLAGSIEMYLGVDVLAGTDGTLSPVQWRSYIEGMKAYQGEVLDKVGIQKRFREKVKLATADPAVIASQDWSGLDAIIDSLIKTLRR